MAALGDSSDDRADRVSRQRQNDAAAPRAGLAGARRYRRHHQRDRRDRDRPSPRRFRRGQRARTARAAVCAARCARISRATLRSLLDRREAGEIRRFRRIVDRNHRACRPGADPVHARRRSDARPFVCIWRGSSPWSMRSTAPTASTASPRPARQAALADTLVITKTDLAPLGPDLVRRLDALNDRADRILAAETRGCRRRCCSADGERTRLLRRCRPSRWRRPHPRHRRFRRDPRRRDEPARFRPRSGRPRARARHRPAAGQRIVRFADRPDRPAVVQAAQHAMFAPEWLDDWPDQDQRSRLVFIVHDIPRGEILAHFAFARRPPPSASARMRREGWRSSASS